MTFQAVLGVYAGTVSMNYNVSVDCPEWLSADLACVATDPDTFFPDNYGMQYHKQIRAAKQICSECPIRVMCLEWAVCRPDLDGIWAGTTPLERRRLRTRGVA